MKKILGLIAIASIVAACNSNPKTNTISLENTKNYQDSLALDSFKRAEAVAKEIDKREIEATTAAALAAKTSTTTKSTHTTRYVKSGNGGYSNSSSGSNTVQSQPAKKGWSSAAKGTAIGAGAGAVTGILIDKKDGRGAIIGGVVGAGTGYVIGRSRDRKSGRVQQ